MKHQLFTVRVETIYKHKKFVHVEPSEDYTTGNGENIRKGTVTVIKKGDGYREPSRDSINLPFRKP